MNDLTELKEYVRVHAKGQGIREHQAILDAIGSDGTGPGSWTGEWCRAAQAQASDLAAARRYAMAAFPFADGPARQDAHQCCLDAMGRWAAGQRGLERLEVKLAGKVVRCWAAGLDAARPLVLIMGGIVTLKEQWVPVLPALQRMGLAGLVTEMPSVGENGLRYGPGSYRMLRGLMDALAGRADVTRTHLVALSFSGHMALRAAVDDPRIRSVVTVGAPVAAFFTDRAWQARLPQITVQTLAHLTGTEADQLLAGLPAWALTPGQLGTLGIDVSYVASRRDEIIPPADSRLLAGHVRRLRLLEYDDVHGSPGHVRETQLWTLASVLRSVGHHPALAAIAGFTMRFEQARRRFK